VKGIDSCLIWYTTQKFAFSNWEKLQKKLQITFTGAAILTTEQSQFLRTDRIFAALVTESDKKSL